eukprot:gene1394-1610_t
MQSSPDVSVETSSKQQCWPAVKPLAKSLSFEIAAKPAQTNIAFPCLVCEHQETESRPILEHMFHEHKIVIGEVNSIANLSSYLYHWRGQMAGKPLTTYTSCIQTKQAPDQAPTNYFLLSDILAEDQHLRRKLQIERLGFVLDQQHKERSDPSFKSTCPMCPLEFKGDRSAVSSHLFESHNFNIGLPDNLVGLNDLLDILGQKMADNQCLFCEKMFKSKEVLKAHMKKKKHTRLNPHNTIYDQFYLLNYMEPGKNWEEIKKEDEDDTTAEQTPNNVDLVKQENQVNGQHVASQWDDWTEDDDEPEETVFCLFCTSQFDSADLAFTHMANDHKFNFHEIRKEWNVDYYDCIKMINFIRRHMYELTCCQCGSKMEDVDALRKHMASENHCGVQKDLAEWRDAQYLLPTYENDCLLRNFESFDDDEDVEYQASEERYKQDIMGELQHDREVIQKQLAESNITLN